MALLDGMVRYIIWNMYELALNPHGSTREVYLFGLTLLSYLLAFPRPISGKEQNGIFLHHWDLLKWTF